MNLVLKDCFGPKHLEMDNQKEFGFCFCNDGKIYCFKTSNSQEKNEWFTSLREALSH